MNNIAKKNQIIEAIKNARACGKTELMTDIYVTFDDEYSDLVNYLEETFKNIYVRSTIESTAGGYLYIDWHLVDMSNHELIK